MTENQNKLVHVNAYTKSDGTEVKEHYRGGSSRSNMSDIQVPEGPLDVDFLPFPKEEVPDVIQGRVEKTDYPSAQGNSEDTGTQKGSAEKNGDSENHKNSSSKEKTVQVLEGIKAAAGVLAELTKNIKQKNVTVAKLQTALSEIEQGQQKAIIRQNLVLDYLTNTKNKQDYTRAYKNYIDLRRLTRENSDLLAKINYSLPRHGIDSVVNDLEQLNTNFDEIVEKTHKENPIRSHKFYKDFTLPSVAHNFSNGWNRIFRTNNIPKYVVDAGMVYYNRNNSMPDAAKMWKATTNDFNWSKADVSKNGTLVYSINNLPSQELQNIVRQKVQGQKGTNDALGYIYQSHSNLAKEIAGSPELKKHFQENKGKLLNKEVVKGGSTRFTSSSNLSKALGHADFVYTYIEESGNLCTVVMDTYDFNKFDPDWKVQIASMAQELGTIRNYYEIIIIKTPEYIWKNW